MCSWRNQRSKEYERERRNWKGNEIFPPRAYSGSLCVGRSLTSQTLFPPIHDFTETYSLYESQIKHRPTTFSSSHLELQSNPVMIERCFLQTRSKTMPVKLESNNGQVQTRDAFSAIGLVGKQEEKRHQKRILNKKEIDSVLRKSAKSAILVGNVTPLRMTVKVPAAGQQYNNSQENLAIK